MTLRRRGSGDRGQGDEGLTLILVALALVAILMMVAIVIDYGSVRNSRQANKLTTDVVASAGAQALAPDAVARPWRGACSALTYLRANERSLSLSVTYMDGNGTTLSGNPCASLNSQECVPNTKTSWAWIRAVDSGHTFEIKSGYALPDAAFPEDATVYSGDTGAASNGGCDQLAVISYKTDGALFGGIAGVAQYATAARSVGRVRITIEGQGVPAFLMLERAGCDVLSEQVGSGEAGIIVNAASATQPGVIHVDSAGASSAGCSGTNGPGGWPVYSSSGPKIVARPAANGTPGIIAIHALQLGVPPNHYGGSTSAGLSPAPTAGRVVSRKPVDDKYNPSAAATITGVHSAAYTDANRTLATAPPSSYPAARPGTWTTTSTCNNPPSSAATKIFVNCPGGFSAGAGTTFSAATDIIFNGPVTIANNRQLYMPAARRIVVGGTSTAGLALSGGGQLGVNSASPFTDTDAGVDAACNGREGPAWTPTTELVIFGGGSSGGNAGALNLGGRAALCQTFVYLAGPKAASNANYSPQQITNGTYAATCLAQTPCPLKTGNPITNAHLVISGRVKWSAPNQLSGQPTPGSVGLEDLSLWTETATLSEIKSGGVLQARGVYFLPNDRMEMRSPALASPQDAQFIAQSLQLLQGAVTMQPTPSNAVQIPVLGGVGMVR